MPVERIKRIRVMNPSFFVKVEWMGVVKKCELLGEEGSRGARKSI